MQPMALCGEGDGATHLSRLLIQMLSSVHGLLERAMKSKDYHKFQVMTACSGTDAPIIALEMFKELFPGFDFTHVLSCEIEPFKQAFIYRNMVARSDTMLFPDIVALCNDDLLDVFQQKQTITPRLPGGIFIAGTSCKQFSMHSGTKPADITEHTESGETFIAGRFSPPSNTQPSTHTHTHHHRTCTPPADNGVDWFIIPVCCSLLPLLLTPSLPLLTPSLPCSAIEFIYKHLPPYAILENVFTAPWSKMCEYITGRLLLETAHNADKCTNNSLSSQMKKISDLMFIKTKDGFFQVREVSAFTPARADAIVEGIEDKDGVMRLAKGPKAEIKWPKGKKWRDCKAIKDLKQKGKAASADEMTLREFKALYQNTKLDTLVFETPAKFRCELFKADSKMFGLPQTRNRGYA